MKLLLQTGLVLVLAVQPAAASADSEDAFCEVHEHGDEAKDATGYCTVDRQDGRIRIRLANGEAVELEAGDDAGVFHDRDGGAVSLEVKPDGAHRYAWAQRSITVYFTRAEGQYF